MRGWRTITSVLRTPCVSCSSLAAALCVLQLLCISQKTQTNRKENEHVENLLRWLVTLFFVRQSCCVVHNTVVTSPLRQATPGSSALLLVYQSSHRGMTETGENTALPQTTTKDRVNKICYVYMNLFTKMMYKEKTLPGFTIEYRRPLLLSLLP